MSTHHTLLAVTNLYELSGSEFKKVIDEERIKRKEYVARKRKELRALENKNLPDPKDFFDLREDKDDDFYFDFYGYHNQLPQYCLNEKGICVEFDGQFDLDDEKIYHEDLKYHFFDLSTCDPLLSEEISNIGICDIIENDDLRPIFQHFAKLSYRHLKNRSYPSAQYIVVNISYWSDYFGEWDSSMGVAGYLDNNLKSNFEIIERREKAEQDYWQNVLDDMEHSPQHYIT